MVNVARALEALPRLRGAACEGSLSWDQLRQAARFTSAEADEEMARLAPGLAAGALRRMANRAPPVVWRAGQEVGGRACGDVGDGADGDAVASGADGAERELGGAASDGRLAGDPAVDGLGGAGESWLRMRWTSGESVLRLSGRFGAPEGAVIERVIEQLAERAPVDPENGTYRPFEQRAAEALVDLATGACCSGAGDCALEADDEAGLPEDAAPERGPAVDASARTDEATRAGGVIANGGTDAGADAVAEAGPNGASRSLRRHRRRTRHGGGATIFVHADLERLLASPVWCQIEGGPGLGGESLLRTACDAAVGVIVERDGVPVGVGRRKRVVPPWLSRLLRGRDAACRFPGCGRTKRLSAHHIRHWSAGGPTDADNLRCQ